MPRRARLITASGHRNVFMTAVSWWRARARPVGAGGHQHAAPHGAFVASGEAAGVGGTDDRTANITVTLPGVPAPTVARPSGIRSGGAERSRRQPWLWTLL